MTGNLLWSPKEADNQLKRFIKLNQKKIKTETEILKKWLSTNNTRYNTYKFLNDI